jgi:hypothetical protein
MLSPAGAYPTWLFSGLLGLVAILLSIIAWQFRSLYAAFGKQVDEYHDEAEEKFKELEVDVTNLNRAYWETRDIINRHMSDLNLKLAEIKSHVENVPEMQKVIHDATGRINRLEVRFEERR